MRLTKNMRATLTEAKQGLRRVHDSLEGKPPWPANPSTLAALVRHELVAYSRHRNKAGWWVEVWRTNEAGEEALKPRERPPSSSLRLLAAGSRGDARGYTSIARRAVDEMEAVPDSDLERFAKEGWERHRVREDAVEQFRRVRERAQAEGVDTTRYEARVRQAAEVLERRRRAQGKEAA